MSQVLRFVRVFALGTWVGAITYFATVVTQGAFAVLPNRDEAGLLVGYTLGGLHHLGVIAAVVYVVATLVLLKREKLNFRLPVIAVLIMLVLTVISQNYVMPRMAVLRSQMGSVDATPSSDSRRAEFDRLHRVSVDLEGSVLVIGLVALFMTVREERSPA
ncbi:MAG: DUF4149 domain-containing protein [Candidatus Acidiferrales bacterium]|jgi:hypothetical protein